MRLKFFSILVVFNSLFLGCSDREVHVIHEKTTVQPIGKPLNKEQFSVKELFTNRELSLNEIVNHLVGLRYYKSISKDDLSNLKLAWLADTHNDSNWNQAILDSERVKIVIAELLVKYDAEEISEYYEYVNSMLRSRSQSERAYAALSIGFIGSRKDISKLSNMLINDEVLPAIQAGMGLLAMNDLLALDEFSSSLEKLSEKNDLDSKHVYSVLKNHLEIIKKE